MTDLGTLGGTIGTPIWLNDWGQVVGSSNLAGDVVSHAFLWSRGKMKDLAPASGGDNSWAWWINNLGDVIGASSLPGDELWEATLWKSGTPINLGVLGQDSCAEAFSINNFRQVVGISDECGSGRAFLWENGGPMVDLNVLVENPSDLHLLEGTYITDSGEIVAEGVLPNGDMHAAVLVPHGDCSKDCEQRIVESMSTPTVRARSMIPASGNLMNWLRSRQRLHRIFQRR